MRMTGMRHSSSTFADTDWIFHSQIDSRAEAKSLDLQMHQLVIQIHTVGRVATEDGVLPPAVLNTFSILCLGVAERYSADYQEAAMFFSM